MTMDFNSISPAVRLHPLVPGDPGTGPKTSDAPIQSSNTTQSDPAGNVNTAHCESGPKMPGAVRPSTSKFRAGGDFVKPGVFYFLGRPRVTSKSTRNRPPSTSRASVSRSVKQKRTSSTWTDGEADPSTPAAGNVGYETPMPFASRSSAWIPFDRRSDNNNGLAPPERSEFEEQVEDLILDPARPRQVCHRQTFVDVDNDGLRGFLAYGFDSYGSGSDRRLT